MGVTWSQFFPPAPALTEANLPPQTGKVFVVTGGTSGVGYELCRILYQAGGKVYMVGRSEEKAKAAIARITALAPGSSGELLFLHAALDDLATIKPAVEQFQQRESRLDVLFNNAGVSNPPQGSQGAQGHELQFSTNCFGPYLLTQLLLPTLIRTATTAGPAAVRVVWTSSIATDLDTPKNLKFDDFAHPPSGPQALYTLTKTGNWFLAAELARQVGEKGILSVTQNPGNLKSDLTRHFSWVVPFLASPLLHPPKYGGYTELWAGLSPDLLIEDGGKYIIPWGRLHPSPRPDLENDLKAEHEGGTGLAALFAEHCERQTRAYR